MVWSPREIMVTEPVLDHDAHDEQVVFAMILQELRRYAEKEEAMLRFVYKETIDLLPDIARYPEEWQSVDDMLFYGQSILNRAVFQHAKRFGIDRKRSQFGQCNCVWGYGPLRRIEPCRGTG